MLLISCEFDEVCLPEHVKIFYDTLQGDKKYKILRNSRHVPREPSQLDELKNIVDTWLGK